MNTKKVNVLGIEFENTTFDQFIDTLSARLSEEKKTFVVTANPEIVMHANENDEYKTIIQSADYVVADGIGIVKAAKMLKSPLPERVTGFDTTVRLLQVANENHYKLYFLGAKEEVLKQAVEKVTGDYPNLEIVGYHHGFFDWDNPSLSAEMAALKPDIVLVALGLPRQEVWIHQHLPEFEKGVFIGVGGSFDVLAGHVNRAPEIWQKLNLEWFYRLLKQPSRFTRMFAIPKFLMKVLGQKARQSHE